MGGGIPLVAADFFTELEVNYTAAWWAANKGTYVKTVKAPYKIFIGAVSSGSSGTDFIAAVAAVNSGGVDVTAGRLSTSAATDHVSGLLKNGPEVTDWLNTNVGPSVLTPEEIWSR